MLNTYRFYTNREMRHIEKYWQTKTDEELAADLGRDARSITNFRQRFKLTYKNRIQQIENPTK